MLIKVIREAMIKDLQADGSINDKKVESISILQVNGCGRQSFDTKERRKSTSFNTDGTPVYEIVDIKGVTAIYSSAGIAYDFRITDAEHKNLVGKFDGGTGLIATVTIKLDGSVTIA